MIKQIAWNVFEKTGDITAFMEYKNISVIEEQMKINKQNQIQNQQLENQTTINETTKTQNNQNFK